MANLTVEWTRPSQRDDGSATVAANLRYSVERRVKAVDGTEPTDGTEDFKEIASGLSDLNYADTGAPDPAENGTITIEYCVKAHEAGYRTSVCGIGAIQLPTGITPTDTTPGKPTVTVDSKTSTTITVSGTRHADDTVNPREWRFGYRKTSAAAGVYTWSGWASASSAVLSGLDASTEYAVVAQARNSSTLVSATSDEVDVTTDPPAAEKPNPPTVDILDQLTTHNALTVQVAQGSGGTPSSYRIQLATASNLAAASIVSTVTVSGSGTLTHEFTSLSASTTYYARATATNAAGTSGDSNVDSDTTDAQPRVSWDSLQNALTVATGGAAAALAIENIDPDNAILRIDYQPAKNVQQQAAAHVTARFSDNAGDEREVEFTGRSDGSETFRITGTATGRTTHTEDITVTSETTVRAPCKPSVTATATNTSITIQATAGSGQTCGAVEGWIYQYREGSSGSADGSSGSAKSNNSHTFTGLDTDSAHQVRAQARNSAGNVWSDWVSVRTLNPCAGVSLKLSSTAAIAFTHGSQPPNRTITVNETGTGEALTPTVRVTGGTGLDARIVTGGTVLSPTTELQVRSRSRTAASRRIGPSR